MRTEVPPSHDDGRPADQAGVWLRPAWALLDGSGDRALWDQVPRVSSCVGVPAGDGHERIAAWCSPPRPLAEFVDERGLVMAADHLASVPCAGHEALATLAVPFARATAALTGAEPDSVAVLGMTAASALALIEVVERWPDVPVHVHSISLAGRALAQALQATVVEDELPPQRFALVVHGGGPMADSISAVRDGGTLAVVGGGDDVVATRTLAASRLTVRTCAPAPDDVRTAWHRLAAKPDLYRPVIHEAVLASEAGEVRCEELPVVVRT